MRSPTRIGVVFLFLFVFTATARAQIDPGLLPAKLREAMAHVDAQRYDVVPHPTAGEARLTGFDRLQRNYPGARSVQTDARAAIPLIIQGAGIPWIPGSGNQLPPRGDVRPDDLAAIAAGFTAQYSDLLGVTNDDLLLDRHTLVHFGKGNRYWSLRLHQVARSPESGVVVPVRDAHVFFRVNHGNLIQFGNYLAVRPRDLSFSGVISRADAVQKALALTDDLANAKVTDAAIDLGQTDHSLEVVLVNTADGKLGHQLVRALLVGGKNYAAEVWFDAHTGNLVNVINQMDSIDGTVRGGIYPNTNAAGTEDLRALPFIDVTNNGVTKTADASGVYDYAPPGSLATTSLSGKYIFISDSCGDSSLSTSLPPGDMTFGGGGGTDCTNPGVGGAGNTHAGRTAFYHLNLIKEKARKYLDADPQTTTPWLSQQLTTLVNLPNDCNAYWDPNAGVLKFFTFFPGSQGGYDCGNTGEIAAVFLHEFGHGLDAKTNGAPNEGASREAYGDTMAFLQTHDSCIGPGFTPNHPCQDGCTASCTGVRDVNPAIKVKPSNITSSPINCLSKYTFPDGTQFQRTCPAFGGGGVMGFEVHCESAIATGATWDMAQGLIAKYGSGAGWALADRLWYESVYDTGSAYEIAAGQKCDIAATIDGCGSANWYTVLLAIDDDNGNLADGTPNADAIWNAFNGHGIACGAMAPPVFSTCVPPAIPTLTATPGDSKVDLSWTPVANATSYRVYRNEIDCNSGYTPVFETNGTTWTDDTVANAVQYFYRVQAVGSSDTCVSGFSSCQTATPVAPLIPSNIYMVLDQSGSMSGTTTNGMEKKIDALHDAGKMVIDLVDDYATDGFRLGAVSFSTDVTGTTTLKDLSNAIEKDALDTFIKNLQPTNLTAIGKGINAAIAAFPPASTNQKVVMLLSDGIQNVDPMLGVKSPPPGAVVGVTPMPSDTQFYTVALGETIQQDLFDDLAANGGIPGFYYSGGTPEIQSNFAFWIAGVLGLDPAGPFSPGGIGMMSLQSDAHYHVNKTARRITFLVNWPAKGTDLHFELQTPFGTIQPPPSAFHPAQGYAEYTVRFPLRGHGPYDQVGEWVMKVTNNPQQVPFNTYALFDDPVLNLQYRTGGDDPVAGQPLPLEARVFENGTPITGLTVQATLDGPGQGVGEALSASNASPASPGGGDPGSAADRKLATLLRLDPNALGHASNNITLIESEPGVYRAVLPPSQTLAAGTYVVNFSVAGHGIVNGKFERTQRFSRYLRLKPDAGNSSLIVDAKGGVVRLTFTPRDRNNFRLGPGWEDYIKVTSSSGRVGRLVDNLDGSYTAMIEGTPKTEPRITITVRGETIVAR